jgi:hypothetical protein
VIFSPIHAMSGAWESCHVATAIWSFLEMFFWSVLAALTSDERGYS